MELVNIKEAVYAEDYILLQKAHQFAWSVYCFSREILEKETAYIVFRLRCFADLIPENIGKGFETRTDDERFLFIKRACEAIAYSRYFLISIRDMKYINDVGYTNIINLLSQLSDFSRMLKAYIFSIVEEDL